MDKRVKDRPFCGSSDVQRIRDTIKLAEKFPPPESVGLTPKETTIANWKTYER